MIRRIDFYGFLGMDPEKLKPLMFLVWSKHDPLEMVFIWEKTHFFWIGLGRAICGSGFFRTKFEGNKSSTWQITFRAVDSWNPGRETPKHPECGMKIQNTPKASSSRDPKVHHLNLPLRNYNTHHWSKDSDHVRPQKTSPKRPFFFKGRILSRFK